MFDDHTITVAAFSALNRAGIYVEQIGYSTDGQHLFRWYIKRTDYVYYDTQIWSSIEDTLVACLEALIAFYRDEG